MKKYDNYVKIFKAFCDKNRLQILEILQEGERNACDLLDDLQIGQSTLSHHMKILVDAEIVVCRREGRWAYYSIDEEGSAKARISLERLTLPAIKEISA